MEKSSAPVLLCPSDTGIWSGFLSLNDHGDFERIAHVQSGIAHLRPAVDMSKNVWLSTCLLGRQPSTAGTMFDCIFCFCVLRVFLVGKSKSDRQTRQTRQNVKKDQLSLSLQAK